MALLVVDILREGHRVVRMILSSLSHLDTDGDDNLVVPGGVGPTVRQEQGGAHHICSLNKNSYQISDKRPGEDHLHVLVTGGDLQPPLDHADTVLLQELIPIITSIIMLIIIIITSLTSVSSPVSSVRSSP